MKILFYYFTGTLAVILWQPASWASCYKITKFNNTSSSPLYTESGKGDIANWAGGAVDTSGSAGSLSGSINLPAEDVLSNGAAFQAEGSLLASSSVQFVAMGRVKYTPETILFRCSPDEAGKLFEFYSTNGDDIYSGRNQVGSAIGKNEVYQTWFSGVSSRLTNLATGEYYSRYWKSRPLTGLDRDSQGWLLVKAKNFSDAKIELFKNSASKGGRSVGNYSRSQPLGYIAFKGGAYSRGLYDGADHAANASGWPEYWPGAINLYNRVTLTKINTCRLTWSTPQVIFPTVTVAQLRQGEQFTQPVDINFSCQPISGDKGYSGFISGNLAGQTAIGFVIGSASLSTAIKEGVGNPGDSSNWLLSEGYGVDPAAPTGVGVKISTAPQGPALSLFSNFNATGGAGSFWLPVLTNATRAGNSQRLTHYHARYYATLAQLPGKQATAGRYHATLQVVIKVL